VVDDGASEFGGLFEQAPRGEGVGAGSEGSARTAAAGTVRPGVAGGGVPVGVVRTEGDQRGGHGFGRGPRRVDARKIRYDVNRPLSWGASKADRMDAMAAGDMLHAIHCMVGIENQDEARLLAFDKALWWQHTINGASQLQPGRGQLVADGQEFDVQMIIDKLGLDARRFFRAFADDIAALNQEVLASYDAYDVESVERVGILRTLATARGLSKYPHLVHDSADACTEMSQEERNAVLGSKRYYLPSTVNNVDARLDIDSVGG